MLDQKQRHLIHSWRAMAEGQENRYNAFIAQWIAFNAYCYALYAPQAQRQRADLKTRHMRSISGEQQPVRGTLVEVSDRVTIDLEAPVRIKIVIRERYTEDYIFDEFAKQHQPAYESLLDGSFRDAVNDLRSALQKRPGEYFVVNMANADRYDLSQSPKALADKNIIVRLTELRNLQQMKDVLYQIRCNIFHGEKVPGEPNDDRIVTAAIPVLGGFLTMLDGAVGL